MQSMKKRAQSLIEYGLILALVSVVAVVILGLFSKSFNKVGNQANNAVNSSATNALTEYCLSVKKTYDETTGQCVGP